MQEKVKKDNDGERTKAVVLRLSVSCGHREEISSHRGIFNP
jgi:hypothetical protein